MSHHLLERFNISAFQNKEVDSLYFTIGMVHLASGLISIFIPIYLFELGFPIWEIFLFYFLRSAYYLLFASSLFPVIRYLSDKMLMTLSIPPLILFFLGLNYVTSFPFLFYILPGLAAMNMLLLYIGYHLDFSAASDNEHVGEEVGARFVINALVKFTTPFIGGIIIASLGFGYAYVIASMILILAILPLFFFPKRNLSSDMGFKNVIKTIKDKELMPYNISAFGYGAEKMSRDIVWPLFLFIVLGGVEELGEIVSLGFLVGAVISFILGRVLDKDESIGDIITSWSASGLSLIWAVRVFITKTIPAIGSHVFEYIFRDAFMLSWKTKFYKVADDSGDPGLFIASQEFIYHIARVTILPVFGAFAYFLSQDMFFVASFIVASGLSLVLLTSNRYEKSS